MWLVWEPELADFRDALGQRLQRRAVDTEFTLLTEALPRELEQHATVLTFSH